MNPYVVMAVAIALAGGGGAAGWKLHSWRDASVEQAAQRAAVLAAEQTDAQWTAKLGTIRPIYQTINRAVEKETIRETRYSECRHTPASWSLLSDAYAAQDGSKPADPGLSAAEPTR